MTWNSAAWLPRCLDGIEAQGYPDVELIVVDNASADASVDLVQRRFPAARILQNDANRGFAVAQNAAIRATHGEYYLALNPDVALLPGFLELLITALEAHPECGSACGKLLQATDEQPPILDGAGLFLDRARHQYLRGRGEPDTGQYDQPGEVFGADGAAALYRRAMLDDIQIQGEYFDEAFFAYMEDVDLAWRARLMGWYCWYEPAATAYHERAFKPGRRLTMPPGMRRWAVRNRYLMLLKNEGREEFRRDWWRILAYDLGIWAYILVLEQSSLGAIRLVRQQLSQTREWRRTIWQAVRAPPATRMSWFNQAGGPKV